MTKRIKDKSTLNIKIMAQIAKASKSTEKKVAYQKKVEDNGKKVVNWIFGVLILLAIAFVVYSVFIVS